MRTGAVLFVKRAPTRAYVTHIASSFDAVEMRSSLDDDRRLWVSVHIRRQSLQQARIYTSPVNHSQHTTWTVCLPYIEYGHIMNIKAVKYSRIFTNIKTGYESCRLMCYFFLSYFLEQQGTNNCTKPTIVYYCQVMENQVEWHWSTVGKVALDLKVHNECLRIW